MRHSLFAAAIFSLASIACHADTYTLNFTPSTSGQTAPTGSFNYNGTTYSNFVITLSGLSFDFTALANKGFVSQQATGCLFSTTFQYLTATGACTPLYASNVQFSTQQYFDLREPFVQNVGLAYNEAEVVQSGTLGYYAGTFTLTPNTAPVAVTPEPSSLALLSTGVLGVAGILRRRLLA